jgi:hypothetical protein
MPESESPGDAPRPRALRNAVVIATGCDRSEAAAVVDRLLRRGAPVAGPAEFAELAARELATLRAERSSDVGDRPGYGPYGYPNLSGHGELLDPRD